MENHHYWIVNGHDWVRNISLSIINYHILTIIHQNILTIIHQNILTIINHH